MTVVAILGAGPAGLMAAYACERNDLTPVIYATDRQPSFIPADMFLQKPLPDVPDHNPERSDDLLQYTYHGDARGYARKCYGNAGAEVSFNQINWGVHGIWWLREVYETLHKRFEGLIQPRIIGPEEAWNISHNFSLTISTLPATVLCHDEGHEFDSMPTWLVRHRYPNDVRVAGFPQYELTYNGGLGESYPGWFRYSKLRDWFTWEYARDPIVYYPEELLDNPSEILAGKKFLGNTCNCNPKVHRVGRWAQWKRGILNHHAFEETTAVLASTGLGKGA